MFPSESHKVLQPKDSKKKKNVAHLKVITRVIIVCLPKKLNLVWQMFACTNKHYRTECKHREDETFEIQAMFLLKTLILQGCLET